MKTSQDPRHAKRIQVVQMLFEHLFNANAEITDDFAKKIIASEQKINELISQHAPEWPVAQINKIDLAILQLAIYELIIELKEPPKVIIDEAVEVAKLFGSEKSPGFINGVLGAVFKEYE